ncbi:MAG TPA: hypothetical protein PKV27_06485, partial [Ilumatobacteraceae bacterium]|nr:hypothetical protein [Ilumatobacteraceae bacterium]
GEVLVHVGDEVRQRRQLLRDLQRKYGDTLAEVIQFEQRVANRVAELDGRAARLAELEAERATATTTLQAEAAAVGARRRAAAGGLAAATQQRLRTLAMPHAEVVVDVGDTDPGDQVTWMFTANPGSALAPLTKVASGGELARAMLAVRLELSAAPDTLVFDEVDAGIGGRAAQHVAAALAELGRRHQVLVVTHLAQVAAAADTHLVVSKQVTTSAAGDPLTTTSVDEVTAEARVEEIARLLSGNDQSPTAKQHAAELLHRYVPGCSRA